MIPPSDRPNPILAGVHGEPVADPMAIRRAHVVRVRERRREIRDQRRRGTAVEAVANVDLDGRETYGLTRGQFSLVDLIDAALERTGPAALTLCTWTAHGPHIAQLVEAHHAGRITGGRFVVDISFTRRCPQEAAALRTAFGLDALRVTKTHAKWATLTNDVWKLVIQTSMNLNVNPRMEHYTVGHDPELSGFLLDALADLWKTQTAAIADGSIRNMGTWWKQHG